ncbi:4Fe-4S dicluster domain-containing protein [Mesoterricola silvestris]|uniref:Formate dehydrogenase n=1 Tax=Mesoterricola silvestris TaxID=2927979 RepID=A0AA48KAC3_9BACT|nr:4Fe-4S dicluster domain-containing protein [Mesoterricola silvestris]BDU74481.1 formate dehydrogenase [Mesoterricola silvestris]
MGQKKALLIDITLCVGCNACQAACKVENKLPEGEEKALSLSAFTALSEHDGLFVRHMCQHCDIPTCVSACPVGALEKRADGPVLYDGDKCIGCRYCMQACPFHIPRYEWKSTRPGIKKCILCAPRLAKGLPTACAEACPTGATKFGDRNDLLIEATNRITADPGKYVAKIYGKTDVGGTSVLYLSPVPFEKLGFDTRLGQEPMPLLSMNALSKVPNVVGVGSVMLAGIWWITNRREDVAREEGSRKQDSNHENRG